MNIIKKYWDSVYIYVLLIVPGLCMCAGTFWTICKLFGLYSDLRWAQIIIFDFTQLVYLSVALFFIYKNKKDSSYIPERLLYVKGFITVSLFVQYNFIMYLFASTYVWECTFLFFLCICFLFDSKLMLLNIILYFWAFAVAHMLRPEEFLPLEKSNVVEIICWRIMILVLTTMCITVVVYFVERFLMQARENKEENVHLMEKQLKYYKEMELMDTEVRKFRHDIKNHFICMEALLDSGKTDELQAYFQDLQDSFSYQQKIYFSGNDVVDAILHYDLPHYCREEVKVTVYGSLPEIVTISAMDLCTLFSNLLSNAITSANKCVDTKESQITIHFSGGSRYFSIAIANSTLQQSGALKKNTKDRNHGYGINKINEVIEKYGGSCERNVERQTVTIKVYLPI